MTEQTPKLTDLILATRTITEQGGACPYQATGTVLGQHFYFRYRNGYATLEIGDKGHVGIAHGDSYSGSLDDEEFESLFRKLLKAYLKNLRF
ncbi:MAG TPA: hypothetical protein VF867_14210 [Arthrobacter sp.]